MSVKCTQPEKIEKCLWHWRRSWCISALMSFECNFMEVTTTPLTVEDVHQALLEVEKETGSVYFPIFRTSAPKVNKE